jgi:hypothetical protein
VKRSASKVLGLIVQSSPSHCQAEQPTTCSVVLVSKHGPGRRSPRTPESRIKLDKLSATFGRRFGSVSPSGMSAATVSGEPEIQYWTKTRRHSTTTRQRSGACVQTPAELVRCTHFPTSFFDLQTTVRRNCHQFEQTWFSYCRHRYMVDVEGVTKFRSRGFGRHGLLLMRDSVEDHGGAEARGGSCRGLRNP